MPEYTVVDIGADRLESGYPIVRIAAPDVSFEQWLFHAQAIRRQGGILGLVAPSDMLFGLATYQRHHTLRLGPALFIDLFAVFELSRSGAGRRALLGGIEERAERLGCSAVLLTGERHSGETLGDRLDSIVISRDANDAARPGKTAVARA